MKATERSFPVVQFKCTMLHKAVLNCESVNLYSFIDVCQVDFFSFTRLIGRPFVFFKIWHKEYE